MPGEQQHFDRGAFVQKEEEKKDGYSPPLPPPPAFHCREKELLAQTSFHGSTRREKQERKESKHSNITSRIYPVQVHIMLLKVINISLMTVRITRIHSTFRCAMPAAAKRLKQRFLNKPFFVPCHSPQHMERWPQKLLFPPFRSSYRGGSFSKKEASSTEITPDQTKSYELQQISYNECISIVQYIDLQWH